MILSFQDLYKLISECMGREMLVLVQHNLYLWPLKNINAVCH